MIFSFYSLGCKLNQLESEAIADCFRREGFTFVPWDKTGNPAAAESPPAGQRADEGGIFVINTCTVTSMAEQKARRVIRKTLREHPHVCLLATGCYAQMDRAGLEALEDEVSGGNDGGNGAPRFNRPPGAFHASGRLFVIPGEMKDRLLDLPAFLSKAGVVPAGDSGTEGSALSGLLAAWLDSLRGVHAPSLQGGVVDSLSREHAAGRNGDPPGARDGSFRFRPERFSAHSRGFLKIQDGCDRRCAYCRVSLARGKSRSLPAEDALKELRSLEERGFTEVVITGVNISQYRDSHGTEAPLGLPELLILLLEGTEKIRLRLSSIEPEAVTDGLIHVLENPRIRPHFHLSLQSGSAEILSKMGRPYGPSDIEKAVERLRSVKEDPFLACDIIAGFPGETEEEFEKTFALCIASGFAWIHAFPFSGRPGTAACDFPRKVSERDAVYRVERLTELARRFRRDYIGRWEGKEVEAVVEAGKGLPKGFAAGVSENYLKLLIACDGEALAEKPAPGALLRCRILRSGSPEEPIIKGKNPGNSRFDAMAKKTPESICPNGKKVV